MSESKSGGSGGAGARVGQKRSNPDEEQGGRKKRGRKNVEKEPEPEVETADNLDFQDQFEDLGFSDEEENNVKDTEGDSAMGGPEEELAAGEVERLLPLPEGHAMKDTDPKPDEDDEDEEAEAEAQEGGATESAEADADADGETEDTEMSLGGSSAGAGAGADAGAGAGGAGAAAKKKAKKKKKDKKKKKAAPEVFRPQEHKMEAGETLDYDSTAYEMYHALNVNWPCLSFDIFPDSLGQLRSKFPHTLYIATGTQTGRDHYSSNSIKLMKITELHKTQHDEEDDEDDPDTLDDPPEVEEKLFLHPGAVNRIRICPQRPELLATQADTGKVHLWNVKPQLDALDKPPTTRLEKPKPAFTYSGQLAEGFAMDWSIQQPGDCKGAIHLYQPKAGGFNVTKADYKHSDSVEDIQWDPSSPHMFASCSVDKTIRIWDTRVSAKDNRMFVVAGKTDVNVISWNRRQTDFIVSGADDGVLKVWDRRKFSSSSPMANIKHHTGYITSVCWHPQTEFTFAASGSDNMITIWDLSVEPDKAKAETKSDEPKVPDQLLFEHMGQTNIKELHYHPQIPGCLISTAESGFNIFKPADIDDKPDKSAGAGAGAASAAGESKGAGSAAMETKD